MSRLAAVLVGALAFATLPATIRTAPAEAGTPELRAVVVGINEFQGRTRPNVGGVGDAMDVREALLRNGWPEGSIRVLTNGAATADAIRSALQWLSENKAPDSHSVFFYSGHTKQIGGDRDADGEELDEYYWPHDNQFISDGEVANHLKGIGGHAWIGIAACEAAGFDDGVASDKRIFTAASLEHEKGYEYPAWSNSVWAGLFVDEGILQGKADADRNGDVMLAEANDYANRIAPEMTAAQDHGAQHPYFAGGAAHPGSLRASQPEQKSEPPTEAPKKGLCIGDLCLPDLGKLLPPGPKG